MTDTREIDKAVHERWLQQQVRESEEAAKRERDQRERQRVDGYSPTEFAPGLFTFLVETLPCVVCAKPTAADPKGGPFPVYSTITFEAQRDRAGIQAFGDWTDYRKPVCKSCKNSGAQAFECVCCKQKLPLNQSKESFGAPAEHLCTHCYETVPAKKWEQIREELEEQHRWDFE